MNHPNATAAFVTSVIAGGLEHLAQRYGWAKLGTEDATAVAGGAVTVVLFIGKRGIVPTVADVWGWIRHGATGAEIAAAPTFALDATAIAEAIKGIDNTPSGTVDPDASAGPAQPAPAPPPAAAAVESPDPSPSS